MSNFYCFAYILKTGEIKELSAIDGFFGNQYGYIDKNGNFYKEDEIKLIDY